MTNAKSVKSEAQASVILGTCLLLAGSAVAVASTERMVGPTPPVEVVVRVTAAPGLIPAPPPTQRRRSIRRSRAS